MRRLLMLMIGMGVGVVPIFIDPQLPENWEPLTQSGAMKAIPPSVVDGMCYFGLAFFALRWWRMADRRRAHRFSLAPILGAGFWAFAPLLIWPSQWPSAMALVLTAAVVQLVSPWEAPPPPATRRMKLRYA